MPRLSVWLEVFRHPEVAQQCIDGVWVIHRCDFAEPSLVF